MNTTTPTNRGPLSRVARLAALNSTLAALFMSSPAQAIIISGSGNNVGESSLQSVHSDFNYWNNIVDIGVGAGIYLGGNATDTGYILTAYHLSNPSNITVNGSSYSVSSSQRIGGTDLRLLNIDGSQGLPGLSNVPLATVAPSLNEQILMTGRGGSGGALSWGLNDVSSPPWFFGAASGSITNSTGTSISFYSNYSNIGSTPYEGNFTGGDSGGPAFIKRNGIWELAGINSTVTGSSFGNYASYVDVFSYVNDIPSFSPVTVPEPSSTVLLSLTLVSALTLRHRNNKVKN